MLCSTDISSNDDKSDFSILSLGLNSIIETEVSLHLSIVLPIKLYQSAVIAYRSYYLMRTRYAPVLVPGTEVTYIILVLLHCISYYCTLIWESSLFIALYFSNKGRSGTLLRKCKYSFGSDYINTILRFSEVWLSFLSSW